jgi:hypothetical protein
MGCDMLSYLFMIYFLTFILCCNLPLNWGQAMKNGMKSIVTGHSKYIFVFIREFVRNLGSIVLKESV